jgi:hypothetical protein
MEEGIGKYVRWSVVFLLVLAGVCIACQLPLPLEMEPPSKPPEKSETTESLAEVPGLTNSIDSESGDWKIIEVFQGNESSSDIAFYVPVDSWRMLYTADTEFDEHAVFEIFLYRDTSFSAPIEKLSYMFKSKSGSESSYDGKGNYYLKVIAANLKAWTIIVEGHTDESTVPAVQITRIHYSGTVYAPEDCQCYERDEPDEYVVITNTGDGWEDIRGWVLKNVTRGYPSFTFPEYFPCFPSYFKKYHKGDFSDAPSVPCILGPKQNVVVYTDELNPDTGCLSFNFGTRDIWDNEIPDVAVLYDKEGVEISRKSYVVDITD